jgi:hypothetical protein
MEGLRWRWTLAFLVGELVGFIPPAVTGAALAAASAPDLILVVGLTTAGLAEGAALGVAQARVLRRYAPSVSSRDWVAATTVAAGFAWFVGMGSGALLGTDESPPALLAAAMVPAWAAALLAMGLLQWLVLRRTVPRSLRWVPVTAGAWLLGVAIPVLALSAAPNSWPAWSYVAVGVSAAVAMGLTVGVLTGGTLQRLLASSLDMTAASPLASG